MQNHSATAAAHPQALIMLSGGIDSTVLSYDAYERYNGHIMVLTSDTARAEVESARLIADKLNVPHIIYPHDHVAMAMTIGASTFRRITPSLEIFTPFGFPLMMGVSNAIFFASWLGIPHIEFGWRREDFHVEGQPDQMPKLLEEISTRSTLQAGPSISAPFFQLSKAEVIGKGLALGAPLELTSSCIDSGPAPCGICCRCVERRNGFATWNASRK